MLHTKHRQLFLLFSNPVEDAASLALSAVMSLDTAVQRAPLVVREVVVCLALKKGYA